VRNYFVFDTNALISAHLKEGTTSALAFHKGLTEGIIAISDDTLREFATRFARKRFDKYISAADRAEAIIKLSRDCLLVNPSVAIKACRDPDDDMFLSLAVAIGAVCIITRDLDLLTLHPFRGIAIVSPFDFLKRF
jgi:uncharacterized protein